MTAPITKRLIQQGYDVTDDDVRELASTKLAAGEVDGKLGEGYFKVMLRRVTTHPKFAFGEGLKALEDVDSTMYGIVLSVVNDMEDCRPNLHDSKEVKADKAKLRNSRTNYARSAKSVIKKALTVGVNLDSDSASKLGKTALEAEAKKYSSAQLTPEQKVWASFNSLSRRLSELKDHDESAYARCVEAIKTAL